MINREAVGYLTKNEMTSTSQAMVVGYPAKKKAAGVRKYSGISFTAEIIKNSNL
ncbi:MAG: hypothetical protein K6F93_03870 [Lachnospiraceae bacterium]|nr:hypothetical protein [Lachnospiraceae bacterium]